ncbi:MAG: tetratricopeptide repeat protein [Granulosicoccus sp.]|nr:tetratricopeptide repeat protein [Granulosicoccus sp.]
MSPGTALAQADGDAQPVAPRLLASEAGEYATSGVEETSVTGQSSMDSQLMFELMIAELAGRRGQLDVATAGYLRAAEHTSDPRVSERATRLAMYSRQWTEAEKACKRWLALSPGAAEANEMLAQALLRQNKTDEAVGIYRELLTKSADQDQTLRQIQVELQSLDDSAQALLVMQSLLDTVEDNSQAYMTLARLQMAGNDRDGALASTEQALSLDASNSNALLLKAQLLILSGKPDDGFEAVETVLETNPDKLALRLGYAQLLVEAGRFDSVGEQLDTLFEKNPGDPDTLLNISMLALDARRMERARQYLTNLLETGQYPDQANFYLARISDQQQDYESAIGYYDAVSEGDLQLAAQIRIAELLGLSGELEQGRARLRRLSAGVQRPELRTQLLSAESRMLQQSGQAVEAVSVLTEGLKQYPDNGDLLYARALAADVAGDNDMMIADLTRLIESQPDNAHALNALGYHYADKNINLSEAETLLVRAIELLPNDPAIMDSLGWLRYRLGQYEEAISVLRAAYKLYPDPEIAAHLGEVLWLNGNEDDARRLIDEALLVTPEDTHLQQVLQKYIE